ncbi:alpha/beta fold hydrolase [Amycolatopsis sp. NPDC088138]|uniref:alpha/beta fold hydrolase n=1 Tax=Amycolatopsis sp. NPDC088138 TaxID=3363938 RepID=UPI0037F380FF
MTRSENVMPSVDVDGTTVNYHITGEGPVCLVHPGGPGFAWRYLRAPALEEHLTTVYLEPIGTGGSGRLPAHPHGYTRERYARAVEAVLDDLGVAKAALLGHSHGGFVAQYCALHLADRLSGVVLYESAPALGPDHFAEADRNLTEFARRHHGHPGVDAVVEAWRSIPEVADDEGFTAVARALLPVYFADFWGRAEEFFGFAHAVAGSYVSGLDEHGVPDRIDDRDALGSITVDTLVIVGRHDFICGPRWAEDLRTGIPGARLVVLERSGHFGHLEQPAEFARAVTDFVRDTAG